jgi:hypothetical protein
MEQWVKKSHFKYLVKSDIRPLLIIEAALATLPVMVAIPFMRERPKFPPSFCAVDYQNFFDEQLNKYIAPRKMIPDIWTALKNPRYMSCSIGFGISKILVFYNFKSWGSLIVSQQCLQSLFHF